MEYVEVKRNNEEWNFVNSVGKKGIHKLFQYPGTMVPNMLTRIIEDYLSEDDKIILDPFMGSGTVLFEVCKSGRKAIGIDINPYACFGASVKSKFYSKKTLYKLFHELKIKLYEKKNDIKLYSFPYIDKWYTKSNILNLSKIRGEIMCIKSQKYRNFFLLCLAEVAGKVSNSRNSTFKLHVRSEEEIKKRIINPIDMFLNICLSSIKIVVEEAKYKYHTNIQLFNENTVDLNKKRMKLFEEKVDAIITSPPYGDNHTTITYGQYSYLRYSWIGVENLNAYKGLLNDIDKISGVDSNSAGGRLYNEKAVEESEVIKISKILEQKYNLMKESSSKKARKVVSFYIDFYKSLENTFLMLKENGLFILIVGDRTVSGEIIPFKEILIELSKELNLCLIDCIPRRIVGSYMAGSIKQEHIVVFKKT